MWFSVRPDRKKESWALPEAMSVTRVSEAMEYKNSAAQAPVPYYVCSSSRFTHHE